jgi:hypothetical protein
MQAKGTATIYSAHNSNGANAQQVVFWVSMRHTDPPGGRCCPLQTGAGTASEEAPVSLLVSVTVRHRPRRHKDANRPLRLVDLESLRL